MSVPDELIRDIKALAVRIGKMETADRPVITVSNIFDTLYAGRVGSNDGLKFTSAWSNYPGPGTGASPNANGSEILNDIGATYKALLLVGNRSRDATNRMVVLYDRLGIQQNNPAFPLDVTGGVRFTGTQYSVDGIGTLIAVRDGNGGWMRTYGATGWYNQTYGGGIHMADATYIRTMGTKAFMVDGADFHTTNNIQRWNTVSSAYVAGGVSVPLASAQFIWANFSPAATNSYAYSWTMAALGLPSNVKGLLVRVGAKWAAASDNSYISCGNGTYGALVCRASTTNYMDQHSYIPITNGSFYAGSWGVAPIASSANIILLGYVI